MLAFVGTRVPVLLLGVLAVMMIGTVPPRVAEAVWRVSPNELANLMARWDTAFYHSIATDGYSWDRAAFLHQNVVFFPLYPLLMRWGGALVGGHPLLAGAVISQVAFGLAMVVLYRLAAIDVGEAGAWPVVLLVATFPYALFFSVVYTESLFLLLTVGAFYAMRRGYLVWAALCGFAAGLTRPNGFWLAIPLALMAGGVPVASGSDPNGKRIARAVALAPILGAGIYSAFLYWRFGDALAWLHGQAAWGMPLLGRGPALDPIRLPGEPRIKATEAIVWIGNIAAFAAAAAAIRPVSRRFGLAYGVWIAVNIFPPVAAHLFISLGRFIAVLFPVFYWMALRIPRPRLMQVAGAFAAGQALLAVWFFLWKPVV
jgi:mannosyltransferase PIG-V